MTSHRNKQNHKLKFLFRAILVLLIAAATNVCMQANYVHAKNLDVLFNKNEKVKIIKNPITGRARIIDKNGNVLLASYNSTEDVGIVTDLNSGKQVLIYKSMTGVVLKKDGKRYYDGSEWQGERIAKSIVFYDLFGKEVGVEVDDYRSFYLMNNKLIVNCWSSETEYDDEEYIQHKKQMIYYNLEEDNKKAVKLFDDFGKCKYSNPYLFVNFDKGYYYDNMNVDTNLYVFDINMNQLRVLKSAEMTNGTIKYYLMLHFNKELEIENKRYYEVYYVRNLGTGFGEYKFANLLDENFEYVFKDDIAFIDNKEMFNQDEERKQAYIARLNDKTKLAKKGEKRDNIYEKVSLTFKSNKKYYYIINDDNYIRITDYEFNDIIEKTELPNLYRQMSFDRQINDVSEEVFYSLGSDTKDYYVVRNNKLVKLLSESHNESDTENNTTTYLVGVNGGYFFPLSFKRYYDKYGDECYETTKLDEIIIYNVDPNISPFIAKANWIDDDHKFEFDYYKLEEGSPFFIMQLNDRRLLRFSHKREEGNLYNLYDENGENIASALYLCRFTDDDKDTVIISSIADGTRFYNINFEEIGHLNIIYNRCYVVDFKQPYGKTLILGTELKDGTYLDATIIIDKKMNVIYKDLKGMPFVISDRAKLSIDDDKIPFSYLFIQKSVSDRKDKNGDAKYESFIIDSNYNKVFSTYDNIDKQEYFYNEDKETVMVLQIYDSEYVLFDNKLSVIERGPDVENCFKDIKERYKNNYSSGTEDGSLYANRKELDEVTLESFGFGIKGKNYVNLTRPNVFETINIKDTYVLYRNEYKVKKNKDNESNEDSSNMKSYYRYTLINTSNSKIVANDYLDLTNFKDNYFEFRNAFKYGFMDYEGNEIISFSIFDDLLFDDLEKYEIDYMYRN